MENAGLKESGIERVVKWAKSKGFSNIKANVEGFDPPTAFNRSSDDEDQYIPDVTAVRGQQKHYFEVALKTEDPKRMVRKWKLLSTLAEMKNGKLHLFAPRGHKAFAERIVRERQLSADVVSI
jgi:hypothetical protein